MTATQYAAVCIFIYTSLFAQIAATKQIKQHTNLTNSYDKSKNLLNTALRSAKITVSPAQCLYTWGEMTSHNLRSLYVRYFVGITWHNVWS